MRQHRSPRKFTVAPQERSTLPRFRLNRRECKDVHDAAATGDRLEALHVPAVTAGLRQGELLALHWRDVDLDEGWMRVVGSLYRSRATG